MTTQSVGNLGKDLMEESIARWARDNGLALHRDTSPTLDGTDSYAVFDTACTHRFALTRRWAPTGRTAVFVMLNPSTASAAEDDATLRRCRSAARRTGHNALVVINLFTVISTDPDGLVGHRAPSSPLADNALTTLAPLGDTVIAAWGTRHSALHNRAATVIRLLQEQQVELWCLGTNRDGSPRHPVRLPELTPLIPYQPPTPQTASEPEAAVDPDRPTALTDAEIAELRARSARECGPFTNPRIVSAPGPRFHNRQWAEAIVGEPLTVMTWPRLHLLHLAMQAEPEPPATRAQAVRRIAADPGRREDADRRAEAERVHEEAARKRWAAAVAACPVPVTVRANIKSGRRVRGGQSIGRLLHITPLQSAASGTSRQHPAGRGLCEQPGRPKPLILGEPVDSPATCRSCRTYLTQIRPAGAPTRDQALLLEAIERGDVTGTHHPTRGWTVRTRSTKSGSSRTVTTAAQRLLVLGWAAPGSDDPTTRPWALTTAGRNALALHRA